METMFSTMLQLPLFQGLRQEDFTNILGKVKLHFAKHKTGKTIITEGEPCNGLIFLIKGKVSMSTTSRDSALVFTEYFNNLHLIEPQALFGMTTRYTSTYTAASEVGTLSIDKEYVVKELFKYEIFRINFINYTCNRIQTLNFRIWNFTPDSMEHKVIHFILMHSEKAEGEKILNIKMDDLARNLDETRLNISKALNELQSEGLLQLRRKEIYIPEARMLVNWLGEHNKE